MTLKITKSLAARMFNPSPDVVYNPHSFCSIKNDSKAQWTHPDEQYVIEFDRKTKMFTGHYYDWDEERQDWVDTDPMTAEQIMACIEANHLIFAA